MMLAGIVRPARQLDFVPFSDTFFDGARNIANGDLETMSDWLINASFNMNDSLPTKEMLENLEKRQILRTVLQYLSCFSLLFYAYVMFVVVRHFRATLNNPFYAYVLSLAMSDLLILIYIAARLAEREVLRKLPWFWIMPFLVQLSWYSNLFNVLGLTCTRFVAVVLHRNAKNYLRWRNVIISLIFVWLCSFAWAVPILLPSQRELILDKQGYVVFWELAYYYRWTEIVFSVACMFLCFSLYLIMFEFVRRARCRMEMHKSRVNSLASSAAEREPIAASNVNSEKEKQSIINQRSVVSEFRDRSSTNSVSTVAVVSLRQEFPILVQSFLITSSLALVFFSSYAYMVLEDSFLALALNQCAVLLNSAMNPLLYVIFSTAVRQLVFSHAKENWIRYLTMAKTRFANCFCLWKKANEKMSPDSLNIKKGMNRKISLSCPILQEKAAPFAVVHEPCSMLEMKV